MATDEKSLVENPFILAASDFEVDAEGWSSDGDVLSFGHSPGEGVPGGCLKAEDRRTGGVIYYVAPSKFRGAKPSAVRLEYDIKWTAAEGLPIFTWDRELELSGGGRTLIHRSGTPPRNQWTHVVVYFEPGAWTNITAHRLATEKDFAAVLASVDRLAIRAEFAEGAPELGYLDNVVMYAGSP